MKRYLICSADESVTGFNPQAVLAENAQDALQKYLLAVYSKDSEFRAFILDLAPNMTFVEKFYLTTGYEEHRFDMTHKTGTEKEIIHSRVKTFFAARPDLGDRFVRYMETEDRTFIDDEVFEYIAVNEDATQHGFVVLDPDAAPVVAE